MARQVQLKQTPTYGDLNRPQEESPDARLAREMALKASPSYGDLHQPARPQTASEERLSMLLPTAIAANDKLGLVGPGKDYDPTGLRGMVDKHTGGSDLTRWMTSPAGQEYLNNAREFVANVGYAKSGANLTDHEWETGRQSYIPQPGESDPKVIEDKANRRRLAIEAMHSAQQGGGSWAGSLAQQQPTQKRLPPGFQWLPDGRVRGPDGAIYRPPA